MNKKQKILIVGAVLFAALFLFSGVMMAWQYADGKQSADAFDAVADLIQPVEMPQPGTIPGIEGSTEEPDPELIALEKYAAVHEQNSDFVGWVSIDGTNINYPVMQTIDNPNFYLKRGFEKQYSNYGVPYVQENCALGISDNMVIYGHHMNNGSMFADLCKYEREDFYQEHPTIHFDTLSSLGEYEIVAVFKTVAYSEDGFKYYHFVDAEDETAFDAFISQCKALALYDTGVSAKYGDKLLTLSTCEYSRTNGRMVVVAKLIVPPSVEVGGDA
jgi:sortase B